LAKIINCDLNAYTYSFKSLGCSCDFIKFEEAVEWADEIFIGRLLEIKEVEFEINEQQPKEKYTRVWYALFEIEKKWKGSNKKFIKVFQPSTSCDADFGRLGRDYLVYAKKQKMFRYSTDNKTNVKLTTWLCSRSVSDLVYFNPSEKEDDDRPLLNKRFPKLIKLSSFNINYRKIIYGTLIFVFGLFIGYRIKKI
jgi:hypothetical protein